MPTPGSTTARCTVPLGNTSTMPAKTNPPSRMFCGEIVWQTSTNCVPGARSSNTPLSAYIRFCTMPKIGREREDSGFHLAPNRIEKPCGQSCRVPTMARALVDWRSIFIKSVLIQKPP